MTSDKTYTNMSNFFNPTSGTTHMEASTTQNCSTSVTRYVMCKSAAGVENSSSTEITTVTDAAKGLALTGGSLTLDVSGTGNLIIHIIP